MNVGYTTAPLLVYDYFRTVFAHLMSLGSFPNESEVHLVLLVDCRRWPVHQDCLSQALKASTNTLVFNLELLFPV